MEKRTCSNDKRGTCAHGMNPQPLENFEPRSENPLWPRSQCKDCDKAYRAKNAAKINARARKWHRENKTRRQRRSREYLYGLTHVEYSKIKKKQRGRCAICRRSSKLNVDHDHATKKVRGLLCHLCNRGIGLFKDDRAIITRAISYLEASRDERLHRPERRRL